MFRNTMLDNVKELVDVLPLLNVTDGRQIAKHCEEMRTKIAAYSCDQLRDNEALCKKVGQAASDILAAMSAYGAATSNRHDALRLSPVNKPLTGATVTLYVHLCQRSSYEKHRHEHRIPHPRQVA